MNCIAYLARKERWRHQYPDPANEPNPGRTWLLHQDSECWCVARRCHVLLLPGVQTSGLWFPCTDKVRVSFCQQRSFVTMCCILSSVYTERFFFIINSDLQCSLGNWTRYTLHCFVLFDQSHCDGDTSSARATTGEKLVGCL